MMKALNYLRADTIDSALQYLDEFKQDIRILAGGTDLVVRLKQDMVEENNILDISRIKELNDIFRENGAIHLLPLTTHTDILESETISKYAFILREACATIGSPQIRNRGTLGGNIVNASPAGDSISALFVQAARLKLKSINGERVVSIEEFFTGPGKTVLEPNELLVDIFMPELEENETGFFKKLGQRDALAIAVLNVAVKMRIREAGTNAFDRAVVAFGAVAPTVVRGRRVEKAIISSSLDSPEQIHYIARLAFREVSPISDIRASLKYRQDMSINLLYEGLLELSANDWKRKV
jgi:CO/xanthine dehydrogenase FAD-binding subunit